MVFTFMVFSFSVYMWVYCKLNLALTIFYLLSIVGIDYLSVAAWTDLIPSHLVFLKSRVRILVQWLEDVYLWLFYRLLIITCSLFMSSINSIIKWCFNFQFRWVGFFCWTNYKLKMSATNLAYLYRRELRWDFS